MGSQYFRSFALALAVGTALIALPARPADVTPDRLINADEEPQNWLMNHRTYDGQRFSPLTRINKDNVKSLKLAYAVALGGSAGDEWVEATPLFENGFIYVTDSWGVLYKIDARSGEAGRIVWRMEPKQERQANNRGAALWGNLVISPANWPARIIATDKETGRVVWETNVSFDTPQPRHRFLSRTRSSSGRRAATAACATGWQGSMPPPASYCGANSRSRRPASPAARPGRTGITPGRPAAPPCGSRAPTIPTAIRRSGAPAIPCRCTIRSTGRATISTPTARFPGTPRPGT